MFTRAVLLVVLTVCGTGCSDCEPPDPQITVWFSLVGAHPGDAAQIDLPCRVAAVATADAGGLDLQFTCDGATGTETHEISLTVRPPLQLAFGEGEQVRLRYDAEMSWFLDHYLEVQDLAGNVLLAAGQGTSLEPLRGWFAPLTVSRADAGCSSSSDDCGEVGRLGITASLQGQSATVVDGRSGELGRPGSHLLVVGTARWYDSKYCTDIPESYFSFVLAKLSAE
jgi:hypothetical protein